MDSNTFPLKGTKYYLLAIAIVLPLLVASIIFFVLFSGNSSTGYVSNQMNSILGDDQLSQPDSFYNYAYGEIFVAYRSGFSVSVEVYNSSGVEDYSSSKWSKLDEAQIADELGATRVRINHPQYWVVDSVVGLEIDDGDYVIEIADINLQKVNEIEANIFDGNANNSPYSENTFKSSLELTWNAGTEIYELVSPSGEVYRMRSYSQSIDPTIDLSNLNKLEEKLDLPSGWEFTSRTLENEFTFSEDEITLVADDLGNSYLLLNE